MNRYLAHPRDTHYTLLRSAASVTKDANRPLLRVKKNFLDGHSLFFLP